MKRVSAKNKVPGKLQASKPGGEALVEFRVVNGLAVAFNDVVLGTADDPNLLVGHYEMPPPQLWDKPEIPYAISPDLPHPERVQRAVEYFKRNTPVTFIPYQPGLRDVVVFEPGTSNCLSLLGKVGGFQPVKLSSSCTTQEILHEMMHVLGFVHEQSRPDRDGYVEIDWTNIEDENKAQFSMVTDLMMEAERNTPFDYHSIMLYAPQMFAARSGVPVMKSVSSEAIAPVANGLSSGDIERLVRIYGPAYRQE